MLLKVRYGLILKPLVVIKSNERSEDSYIGLADFFFQKKNIDALRYNALFEFN